MTDSNFFKRCIATSIKKCWRLGSRIFVCIQQLSWTWPLYVQNV